MPQGTPVIIPMLFVIIGVALCVGCQFVIIGLYRRREPVFLVFGLMSLAAGAYTAGQIAVYQAVTVAEMALALRARVAFACVCFPLFFALISVYTNWRSGRRWLGVVGGLFALFLVVDLLSPYSLRFSGSLEIRPVSTPWGESLNTYRGFPGKLDLLYRGSHVIIFIWAIWRAIILSRGGEKKRARVLAAYLALQFSALLYEALIEKMGFAWIGASEFAYLALVVIMTFHLGGELHSRSAALERSVTELQGEVAVRREAELALRDSEEKVRSIVETAPDFVFTMDREGKILFINRTVGPFTREQVVGTSGFDYIPPEFHNLMRNALEQAFQTGEMYEYETQGLGDNGLASSWYLNRMGPIVHNEKVVGVTVCSNDITARKQAEEALRQSEVQLRQSQKMEAIGRLAGGVSHDFNNLLTAILGYVHLLRSSDRYREPFQGYLEEIEKAAERAASLTRQLLAFSRKQMLKPVVLDLNTLVTNLSKMLQRLIGEDIELATVLENDLGQVSADPVQMDQVILNLAVNARDAMPNGGKLRIETANVFLDEAFAHERPGMVPGGYVKLAVIDTGCGMDAETKSRIFEPFFTTKEQYRGTGLGLSTVYGIIRQSGGHIRLDSEPGHGTTFEIYLPRVYGPVQSAARHQDVSELVRGRETILLVEDEDAVRDLARRILEKHGYEVLVAASGPEALAIYEQHHGAPRLLLTDMVMPEMSGRELARALKKRDTRIGVLYISGYVGDDILGYGELEPGTSLLAKPFTPEALATKVREVLDDGTEGSV